MNRPNKALINSIHEDITTCQELLTLLKNEQKHLAERDFDSLDKLIDDKGRLLIKLDRNALTRTQWVAKYQANAQISPKEATDTFTELAKEHGLSDIWQQLQTLFKACQEANEVNGKTMVRSRSTHQRLFNILRGQNTSGQLYDGKGGKNKGLSSSSIGQA